MYLMRHYVLDGKKFELLAAGGGNNVGLFQYDAHTVGKVMKISDKRRRQESAPVLDTEDYNENPWREIHVHKRVNALIGRGVQNLVRFHRYLIRGDHLILFVERFDGSLDGILAAMDAEAVRSVFFQILFAFVTLQDKLGFYQGDPGATNVLYRAADRKKTPYFRYTFRGTAFRVPNKGHYVAVADYGNAIVDDFALSRNEKTYYGVSIEKRQELCEVVDWFADALATAGGTGATASTVTSYVHDNFVYRRWGDNYNVDAVLTPKVNPLKMLKVLFGDFIV